MVKIKIMAYAILIILLIVFNVVMFAVPVERTFVFWLSYGFTIVAFLLQIGVCTVAFRKAYTMKSKFLGYPIFHIGFGYLLIQLIACAVFTALSVVAPMWVALIVYVMLLGLTLICLITVDIARDEITRIEERVKSKVFYIKSLQTSIEILFEKATSEPLKSKLRTLTDTVKYSDPISNETLTTLENDIEDKVIELEKAVIVNNELAVSLIDELNLLLVERNKKCKLLK